MATTTFSEVIADDEVIRDVQLIIAAMSMNRGATPDEARPMNVDKAKLAMTLGIAAMIELDIRIDTPRARRLAVDEVRDDLKGLLKGMEQHRAANGRSFLETIGVITGEIHKGGN